MGWGVGCANLPHANVCAPHPLTRPGNRSIWVLSRLSPGGAGRMALANGAPYQPVARSPGTGVAPQPLTWPEQAGSVRVNRKSVRTGRRPPAAKRGFP